MSDAKAVFEGSYADFKLVKTRSVVQVIVEVPIELSNHVLRVLGGMPNPGEEKRLGIAVLADK